MARHHFENPLEEGSEGELNLVPYLDIMVNLVMFLLFTFQIIIQMNVIDLVSPQYGSNPGDANQELSVTLMVHGGGYTLNSSDDTMAPIEIPLRGTGQGAEYDAAELKLRAARWKSDYKLGPSLTLTADPGVEYHVIIDAMDAVRRDQDRELFPNVTLAVAGVEGG